MGALFFGGAFAQEKPVEFAVLQLSLGTNFFAKHKLLIDSSEKKIYIF